MPEKTAAQKRAQQKYMEKFAVARVRMDRERYDAIQAAAAAAGESVNAYINGAIDGRMGGVPPTSPSEAPTMHFDPGAVSLPLDTLKAAQEAAEAAEESIPVFVARAVTTQAQRDKVARKMKKAPDKKSEA